MISTKLPGNAEFFGDTAGGVEQSPFPSADSMTASSPASAFTCAKWLKYASKLGIVLQAVIVSLYITRRHRRFLYYIFRSRSNCSFCLVNFVFTFHDDESFPFLLLLGLITWGFKCISAFMIIWSFLFPFGLRFRRSTLRLTFIICNLNLI